MLKIKNVPTRPHCGIGDERDLDAQGAPQDVGFSR
jgi:hypothetical protein